MACTVCRLPFIPSKASTAPRPSSFPPQELVTRKQRTYFMKAIMITSNMPMGVMQSFEYLDNNVFRSTKAPVRHRTPWETAHPHMQQCGTVFTAHVVCAQLLREALGAATPTLASLTDLCELREVLGEPGGGVRDLAGERLPPWNAGRLPHVDYEGLQHAEPSMLDGVPYDKVDTKPFWLDGPGREMGAEWFDWRALEASGQSWVLSRPDAFPKFFTTVDPSRIPPLPETPGTDIISRQPLDIITLLMGHLPTPAYLALTSTCRTLRHHALTTFQHEARRRVLGLRWTTPLPDEAEGMHKAGLGFASASAPRDADWLLYLSFVHRTPGMRTRRWVWGAVEEIVEVYRARKAESAYADGEVWKSGAREALEKKVEEMNFVGEKYVGAMSTEDGANHWMNMVRGPGGAKKVCDNVGWRSFDMGHVHA